MPERRRKRTNQDRGTDEVKQDRSLLLYVLLSFVTFSVYHFYFMDLWAKDVNILCEKDGKHTVGVEKMMLFSVLTFGVYKYVWLAEIVDRICDNAAEYDVEVRQDSETFFVWMILVPVLGYTLLQLLQAFLVLLDLILQGSQVFCCTSVSSSVVFLLCNLKLVLTDFLKTVCPRYSCLLKIVLMADMPQI